MFTQHPFSELNVGKFVLLYTHNHNLSNEKLCNLSLLSPNEELVFHQTAHFLMLD